MSSLIILTTLLYGCRPDLLKSTAESSGCAASYLVGVSDSEINDGIELPVTILGQTEKMLAQQFRPLKKANLTGSVIYMRLRLKSASVSSTSVAEVHIHQLQTQGNQTLIAPGLELGKGTVKLDSLSVKGDWVSIPFSATGGFDPSTGHYVSPELDLSKQYFLLLRLVGAAAGDSVIWEGSRRVSNPLGFPYAYGLNTVLTTWQTLSPIRGFGFGLNCR